VLVLSESLMFCLTEVSSNEAVSRACRRLNLLCSQSRASNERRTASFGIVWSMRG
jgi:hypothetical protein